MAERKERCETCRFWNIDEAGDNRDGVVTGGCHRYPPKPFRSPDSDLIDFAADSFSFPIVHAIDWCGEWRAQDHAADEPLTLNSTAYRIGLPPDWLKREAEAGRIPCLRVGRRLLFNLAAVKQALSLAAKNTATPHASEGKK